MLQKNKEPLKKYSKLSLIKYRYRIPAVPAFLYLLEIDSQKARGTSVFCILPMVLTSSIFYYKGNFINWNIAILCGIGGAIGGYIGAKLLKKLPEKYFKIAFTIFLFYVSIKMII